MNLREIYDLEVLCGWEELMGLCQTPPVLLSTTLVLITQLCRQKQTQIKRLSHGYKTLNWPRIEFQAYGVNEQSLTNLATGSTITH